MAGFGRYGALIAALLIAGCDRGEKPADPFGTAEKAASAAPAKAEAASEADDGLVACATNGAKEFARNCLVERTEDSEGAPIITIRHPDGGFRRFELVDDGRGVATADGAAEADVTVISPQEIEVAIAGNRYRLPANAKAPAR